MQQPQMSKNMLFLKKHHGLIEKLMLGIIGIAAILHWTSIGTGSLLLIIGLGGLSSFYYLSSYVLIDSDKAFYLFMNKLIHMAWAVSCVGFLFKLMHWPGATTMLIPSVFIMTISCFVLWVIESNKQLVFKSFLLRSVIVLVAFLFLQLINIS